MGADTAQTAGGFRQSLRFRLLLLAILPMLGVIGLFATYFAQHSIAAAERQVRQGGGDMARHLADLGVTASHLSLTDDAGVAMAFVVLEG